MGDDHRPDMDIINCYSRLLAVLLLIACSSCARPDAYVPNTTGWTAIMNRRDAQINQMSDSQERWDACISTLLSCCMIPNFTENGFAVVRQPASIHQRLLKALEQGKRRTEGRVDQISGDIPEFVGIGALGGQIMKELKELHEKWAGIEKGGLVPSNAYGLRIYRPGNTLTMHTDQTATHVISSILHVDRQVAEPWPIVIEGFDGKTHEVDLKPGEMLLYESAKCQHGRPRPLVGDWYTSLFIHYKPRNWSINTRSSINVLEQSEQSTQPLIGGWGRPAKKPDGSVPELRMRGTGMYEPACKHDWCSLAKDWPPSEGDWRDQL